MFAWQATVQDEQGNAVVNPSITVYNENGTTLASIFNENGTAKANPFIGTVEGFAQFWANPGEYEIAGAKGPASTARWNVTITDAYKPQTSKIDNMPGAGLLVGAFGLGDTGSLAVIDSIDAFDIPSGNWGVGSATAGTYPDGFSAAPGRLIVTRYAGGGGWIHQLLSYRGDNGSVANRSVSFERSTSGASTWNPWVRSVDNATLDSELATVQPRLFGGSSPAPIATDGRSLFEFRRAVGRLKKAPSNVKLRIFCVGDSWSNFPTIPLALTELLTPNFAANQVQPVFIQANTAAAGLWPGVGFTTSGSWTFDDASAGATFPNGTGVDGHTLRTTADGASLNFTGINANIITFFMRANGATWRWRVDGGAWTNVTEGSGQGLNPVSTGGIGAGLHTVDIEKVGSTGTLAFVGMRNSPISGVDVAKVGNGGLTGAQMATYQPQQASMWSQLFPDLVICILGTNDYHNSGSNPEQYKNGLATLTTAIKSGNPKAGIIFVVPPNTQGTVVTPLSQYRDAAYAHAIETGCEFLNLTDSWGEWNSTLFGDSVHVNDTGAYVLVDQINTAFLHLERI